MNHAALSLVRLSSISLLAALLGSPAACVVRKSASTGAVDSGEQLGFRAARKRIKVRERQVTGSSDHYNSSGDYVGTSERSRMVTKTTVGNREVRFYQGDKLIGESDFYRIGGDDEAAARASAEQSKLWWMNVGSYALMGVGTAGYVGVATGGFEGGAVTGAYIGSGIAMAAGTLLFYHVMRKRKDARLPLDQAAAIGVRF